MPTAWLSYRSAFALLLIFPWFPRLPWLPLDDNPPIVTEEAGTVGEQKPAEVAPKPPLVLPGVIIEEIPKGSALEKAGLQVGDVVLSWERLPNPPANPEAVSGKIETPFDWMWLEIEQAPRGVIRLSIEHSGQAQMVTVRAGAWSAKTWARFPEFLHNKYSDALEHARSGDPRVVLDEAAAITKSFEPFTTTCISNHLLLSLAENASRTGNWPTAHAVLLKAEANPCGDALADSFISEALATLEENMSQFDKAERAYLKLFEMIHGHGNERRFPSKKS